MGSRNPDRIHRLDSVRDTPPGWVRFVTCKSCGHKGVLPAKALIRKLGETAAVELALMGIRCTECGNRGASLTMEKLCIPGCPIRRAPAMAEAAE